MKENKKRFSFVSVMMATIVIAILGFVGCNVSSQKSTIGKSGVDIEVVTGEGGMPPDTSTGELLADEQFTVVFTEPFSTLENWGSSKVIKEVSMTTGKARINIAAGKYGVYYVYMNQKSLYGNLTLENPRNDIQRDRQGPWYIKVNTMQRTKLRFSINPLPS